MRASNAVRRWELLQLEEDTEHLLPQLGQELIDLLELELTPEEITRLGKKYYDEDEAQTVGFALHHGHTDKIRKLTLNTHLRENSRFFLHCISMQLSVLTKNSVKFEITPFITQFIEDKKD